MLAASAIGGFVAVALADEFSTNSSSADSSLEVVAEAGGPDPSAVPKGPEIDFCPTPGQVEAHLKEYGFDYKPTVSCTRDGQVRTTPPIGESGPTESKEERLARQKRTFMSASPHADSDSDPTTIEGVLPDGTHIMIGISTGNPDHFKGMTPKEFAEEFYP